MIKNKYFLGQYIYEVGEFGIYCCKITRFFIRKNLIEKGSLMYSIISGNIISEICEEDIDINKRYLSSLDEAVKKFKQLIEDKNV